MKRVLVIGGSGFIGAAVARKALDHGHTVYALSRASSPPRGAHHLVGDRNSVESLTNALGDLAFDVVVDATNTPLQAEALLRALGGRCPTLVMISSASVYSDSTGRLPDEDQPALGASVWGSYGKNKVGAEQVYLNSATISASLIVRPPYVFGPGNNTDRETWFWSRLLTARTVVLPGRGETPVQFVHSEDLAEAIVLLAEQGRWQSRIYNVAGTEVLTFRQLCTIMAEAAGVEDRQITVGDISLADPVRSWFPFFDYPCLTPPDRLLGETEWRPTPFFERLRQTFESYSPATLADRYRPTPAEQHLRSWLLPSEVP